MNWETITEIAHKAKNYITTIVAVIITVVVFTYVNSIRADNYQDQIQNLQNQVASLDSVNKINDNLYNQLAMTVDELKSKNKILNEELKKNKEKINSQTNIIATLQDSIINISTHWDSTIVIDTTGTGPEFKYRLFEVEKDGLYVAGNFMVVPPYMINLNKISMKLDLEVNLTETKKGTFSTYIYTPNKNITFSNISTQIVPYEEVWYKKLKFGAGVLLGEERIIIANMLVGYNKFIGIVGLGTNGLNVGGAYFFTE